MCRMLLHTDRFATDNAVAETANLLAEIRSGIAAIAFIGLACFGLMIVRSARK